MTKTTTNKDKVVRRCLCTPTELHIREAAEGEAPSRIITGYAILFNTPSAPLWDDDDSEAREVIAPEAVTEDFLNGQDIKMTMFHDNQLILARSNKGGGTLSYSVDDKGVKFEFSAPNTVDGDKAIELVRRGDISGCSFAFTTRYYDNDFVERQSQYAQNGKICYTYRVKALTGLYDFTLAANPYYQETSVEVRELAAGLKEEQNPAPSKAEEEKRENALKQLREMRRAAKRSIIVV